MNNQQYDNWKLDSPNYSDQYDCERCDELFDESDLQEVTYLDADGDRQTKFICGSCLDRINEGDV